MLSGDGRGNLRYVIWSDRDGLRTLLRFDLD